MVDWSDVACVLQVEWGVWEGCAAELAQALVNKSISKTDNAICVYWYAAMMMQQSSGKQSGQYVFRLRAVCVPVIGYSCRHRYQSIHSNNHTT